jgi:hypothetical protein
VKPARAVVLSAICVIVAVALLSSSWRLSAKNNRQEGQPELAAASPVYNPYPPGILPADLTAEI